MHPTPRRESASYIWLQKGGWTREFILQREGREMGTLKATSWTENVFEGMTDQGRWRFRQEGFWKRVVVCEDASTGRRVATFKPRHSVSDGELEVAGGQVYHWSTSGFLKPRSFLRDNKANIVLEINEGNPRSRKRLCDLFKTEGRISVERPLQDARTTSLLCLLAIYLLVCAHDETSAAGAVVATG